MLKLIRKLLLPDRPYFDSVSGDGKRLAICTRSGKCRLFDDDLSQLDEMDFGGNITWICLNETGSVLLVGFQDHIEGFTTTGNIAPLFQLGARNTTDPACFLKSDEQVICVASWDRKPKLTAWNYKTSTKIDEAVLPANGGGEYMIVPHPEGEAMAVVEYSGQSEEWMLWAHYACGRLRIFSQPLIEDVAFPCFHPTGRELVSYHERLGLCRIGFPSGELMGTVSPEEAFPDNLEDTFSYYIHFLRDDRFLAWQNNLALYEFDLATLRPLAAVLTNVEGMTFGKDQFYSEQSWQLAGGRLLTWDCHYDQEFKNRTDTLRLWNASDLSGPSSLPDPARPYTQELFK